MNPQRTNDLLPTATASPASLRSALAPAKDIQTMPQPYNEVFVRTNLFSGHFIDTKSFYLHEHGNLPNITIVRQVDYERAYAMLRKEFAAQIEDEFHYSAINAKKTKEEKEESVIRMKEQIMLEMGDGYAELYFTNPNGPLYKSLLTKLKGLRGGKRMRPQEINLITRGEYGLELTRMDVKRTRLDIDLFYEDDFKETHQTILRRLNKKDDKGIVLLHGIPGTGKTTYLRYLVGKIKKRVLFIPPDMASQIVNPDLVRLLVDNPNCVLIIEDAENIIMQRQPGSDSAVSNLLNISDGLLSDFLNVQIICTFNSSLSVVDNALLRKGRLIAKYEFTKLSVPKAQRLSQHIGSPLRVITPMSVAEIMNHSEKNYVQERPRIGFRVGEMSLQ
jgi:hypothetical protein